MTQPAAQSAAPSSTAPAAPATTAGGTRSYRKAIEEARADLARRAATAVDTRQRDLLAFAAAALALAEAQPATERDQYATLYLARRLQLGRPLWPHECEHLHAASAELWEAEQACRAANVDPFVFPFPAASSAA